MKNEDTSEVTKSKWNRSKRRRVSDRMIETENRTFGKTMNTDVYVCLRVYLCVCACVCEYTNRVRVSCYWNLKTHLHVYATDESIKYVHHIHHCCFYLFLFLHLFRSLSLSLFPNSKFPFFHFMKFTLYFMICPFSIYNWIVLNIRELYIVHSFLINSFGQHF